jgi:hypothetical protein
VMPDLFRTHTRVQTVTCYACGLEGVIMLTFSGPYDPDDEDWHLARVQWSMEQGPAVCDQCTGRRIGP